MILMMMVVLMMMTPLIMNQPFTNSFRTCQSASSSSHQRNGLIASATAAFHLLLIKMLHVQFLEGEFCREPAGHLTWVLQAANWHPIAAPSVVESYSPTRVWRQPLNTQTPSYPNPLLAQNGSFCSQFPWAPHDKQKHYRYLNVGARDLAPTSLMKVGQ